MSEPINTFCRVYAGTYLSNYRALLSLAPLAASKTESIQAAAKQRLLPWNIETLSVCTNCKHGLLVDYDFCCYPATMRLLKHALHNTTGLTAMIKSASSCPFLHQICRFFVLDAFNRQDCPSVNEFIGYYESDPATLFSQILKITNHNFAAVLHEAATCILTSSSAAKRALRSPPPDYSAVRNYTRLKLAGATAISPPVIKRSKDPDPWLVCRRALGVKIRLPAKITKQVPNIKLLYQEAGAPPLPNFPTLVGSKSLQESLTCLSKLNESDFAAAHVILHSIENSRKISVNWASSKVTDECVIVCSVCADVCSCHAGLTGKRGVIVDPAANVIRCAGCMSDKVIRVNLSGKTITLINKKRRILLQVCPTCRRIHVASGKQCKRCRKRTPETCFCRKPSRTPTTPFACTVNNAIVIKWVCVKHQFAVPNAIVPLSNIAERANVRLW